MNSKLVLAVAALAVVVLAGAAFFFLNSGQTSTSSNNNSSEQTIQNQPIESSTENANNEESVANIDLTAEGFTPSDIEIEAGTKVIWTNNSGKSATVDSGLHPIHTLYTPLNLGSFNDGETHELVFNEPGTYKYHNHLKASQTGSITVK